MVEFELKSWSNQGINNYWLSPWGFPTAGRIFSEPSVFSSRAHLTAPMSSSALSVRAVEYLEMGCGRIDRNCLQLLMGAHQLWGDLQSFLTCSYIPENEEDLNPTHPTHIFQLNHWNNLNGAYFSFALWFLLWFLFKALMQSISGVGSHFCLSPNHCKGKLLGKISAHKPSQSLNCANSKNLFWDLTGKHFGCINI